MGLLKALVAFLRSELVSAFFHSYGVPIVLASLYVVAALMSGQYAPLAIMGATIVFAFACIASAAIEQQRYMTALREQVITGKPLPKSLFPYSKLIKRGAKPEIEVNHYNGQIAVLDVHNKGGDAIFWAQAQILKVSKGEFTHYAPYQMIWQSIDDHKKLADHKAVIERGQTMRLLVAEYSPSEWSGGSRLLVLGDTHAVQGLPVSDRGESPVVFIDVRIHSDPPMEESFIDGYKVHSPRDLYAVRFITE